MDAEEIERIRQVIATMPDALAKISSSTQSLMGTFRNLGIDIKSVGAVTEDAAGIAEGAMEALEKTSTTAFESMMRGAMTASDAIRKHLGIDFGVNFDMDTAGLVRAFKTAMRNVAGETKELGASLLEFVNTNKINLGEKFVFKMGADWAQQALAPIIDIESNITNAAKGILPSITSIDTAMRGIGGGLAGDLSNRLGGVLESISGSAGEMGVDIGTATSAFRELSQAGLTSGDIFAGMSESAQVAQGGLSGLSVAMRLASGMGLQLSAIGEIVQSNLRMLGRTGSDVELIFGALRAAQEGSGLSTEDVNKAIMSGARNFRFYGTTVETLAGTFKSFVEALGEGREELGKELFGNVLTGIERMNFGMKAFLGMQSKVGQGRGAMGAGLQFEKAMEEGNFDEIFGAIRGQLERFGGGRVLTRDEAMATGQETQYVTQRQLLGQMTGVQDAGQLEQLMKALASGKLEQAGQLLSPQKIAESRTDIMQAGQERIELETGAAQSQVNRLRAEESEAIAKMIGSYGESADKIREFSSKLVDNMKDVISYINPNIEFLKQAASYEDIAAAERDPTKAPMRGDIMGQTRGAERADLMSVQPMGVLREDLQMIGGEIRTMREDLLQVLTQGAGDRLRSNIGSGGSTQDPQTRFNFGGRVPQTEYGSSPPAFRTRETIQQIQTPTDSSNTGIPVPFNQAQLPIAQNTDGTRAGATSIVPAEPQTVEATIRLRLDGGTLTASLDKMVNDKIKVALVSASEYA